MGTKERRQRQVAERELLFLETARELIRQDGLLNLQMARIAEKCDYAVGTLYQHFASKEDLLVALATENIQHRAEMFGRVSRWKAGTRDRMFGIAVADMLLVRLHPEQFRLDQFAYTEVVWGAASPERRRQSLEAGEPLGRIVEGIVNEAVRVGDLALKNIASFELATAPWALCEGTHQMAHAEGLTEKYNIRDIYYLMLRHQQALLNGLGWKPFFNPDDESALNAKVKQLCNEVFPDLPCAREPLMPRAHAEAVES
jgi:AcrR family transcriptional regulator